MKSSQNKMQEPKPSGMGKPEHMEDGHIFEKEGLFLFNWKVDNADMDQWQTLKQDLKK